MLEYKHDKQFKINYLKSIRDMQEKPIIAYNREVPSVHSWFYDKDIQLLEEEEVREEELRFSEIRGILA